MIRTILVPARGDDGDPATLAAALAIARPFGAHLDVLHVRLDPTTVALALASDPGSGALTAGLIDQLDRDANERATQAQAIFAKFCGDSSLAVSDTPSAGAAAPSAQFHAETGEESRWMTTYGMTADLIVLARGSGDGVPARSLIEAVLLESGRPLLIPAAAPMPESVARVAIAWKATPQTARAVALAMPFLTRATEVVVLTVDESSDDAADNGDRLARNLAWHGLAARREHLTAGDDGAAATLLAAARDRADLLVMGGYGHNRLREWVFGGFTQQVLVDAPLAVLIAH